MEGYEKLASAIVAGGIEDYYKSGKKAVEYIHHYLNSSRKYKKDSMLEMFDKEYAVLDDCKRFFFSEWFSILTDLNGKVLYDRLNRRIGEYANEGLFK